MSRTAAIFNATNMLAAECERLERERDEARERAEAAEAEVARLRISADATRGKFGATYMHRVAELEAEVERLRARVAELEAENARLQAEAATLRRALAWLAACAMEHMICWTPEGPVADECETADCAECISQAALAAQVGGGGE